eukprot:c7300_g1_i1 orf=60-536(+)
MWRFGGLVRQAALTHGAAGKRWFSIYDQINLLDKVAEDSGRLRFTGYSDAGFNVNNVFHEGAVMCHGSLLLSWTPLTFKDITPESLSLFELLRPAPDILLLGCGRRMQLVSKEVRDFLRSNGIKLEAIDSRNAVSTFNFLNEEGRLVAAALLPYGSES